MPCSQFDDHEYQRNAGDQQSNPLGQGQKIKNKIAPEITSEKFNNGPEQGVKHDIA
jgi:hypothetical protein